MGRRAQADPPSFMSHAFVHADLSAPPSPCKAVLLQGLPWRETDSVDLSRRQGRSALPDLDLRDCRQVGCSAHCPEPSLLGTLPDPGHHSDQLRGGPCPMVDTGTCTSQIVRPWG